MPKLPDSTLRWPIAMAGVALIAEHESCRLKAYPDPISKGKPWTCGWGETEGVEPGMVWTQEYADQRFCDSLTTRTAQVLALCQVRPDPNQLAAMVSLQYNIGAGAFARSSVLKAHNRNDYNAAALAFSLFDSARDKTGKLVKVDELVHRRLDEAALYLRPEEDMPVAPMPTASTPAGPAASRRVQAATVATGAGVVDVLSQSSDTLSTVSATAATAKSFLTDTLGLPAHLLAPALLIGLGLFLAWHWWDQRKGGVA